MMHEHMRRHWFRHGHGHGHGPGGRFFREMFGRAPGWRERPLRRGEVRYVVLETLAEGPKHGYEIMTAIEQKRGLRPSAGSIYPTLQMLEDGGFVTSHQVDGKRTYTITDEGRAMLNERDDDNDDAGDDERHGPRPAQRRVVEEIGKLGAAVMSARGSSDDTLEQIRDVVKDARKQVYAILGDAED